MKCPCQSSPNKKRAEQLKAYSDCCQPFHLPFDTDKSTPQTAEQLMRSRYSAFVLEDVEYIVVTTLPAQQAFLDGQAIADWAKQTDWAGLEIVKHTPKIGKRHAQVEFKAFFNTAEGVQSHHELSAFVKITDMKNQSINWFFIDPTVEINVTQKQPCLCSSGEKFKRCCGQFL